MNNSNSLSLRLEKFLSQIDEITEKSTTTRATTVEITHNDPINTRRGQILQRVKYLMKPMAATARIVNNNPEMNVALISDILKKVICHLDIGTLARVRLIKTLAKMANTQIGLIMLEAGYSQADLQSKRRTDCLTYIDKNRDFTNLFDHDFPCKIAVEIGYLVKKLNLINIYREIPILEKCPDLESLALQTNNSSALILSLMGNFVKLKHFKTLYLECHGESLKLDGLANSALNLHTLILKVGVFVALDIEHLPVTLKAFKINRPINSKTILELKDLTKLDMVFGEENSDLILPNSLLDLTLGIFYQKINYKRLLSNANCLQSVMLKSCHFNFDILEALPQTVQKLSLFRCEVDSFSIFSKLPNNIKEVILYDVSIRTKKALVPPELSERRLILPKNVECLTLVFWQERYGPCLINGEGLQKIRLEELGSDIDYDPEESVYDF